MKCFLVLATLMLFAALFSSASARSEPVCGYTNSQGKMIFLKYLPSLGHGQDYVDFDENGNCVRKVTCLENYTLRQEDCSPEDQQRKSQCPFESP